MILYRHFDSKTELYQAVLDRMCARLEAHVEEPVGGFTDASIDGLIEAAAESPAGFRLLFHHALREPEFKERIEKFRADITAAAYLQISAFIADEALARWAAHLAPVAAVEAITAWLDTGQPEPARQKRVWDKAAPSYDKQIAFFEKIQFGGGREWLGERAHGRVLEVAIGTGRNLPHYPPDTTVAGIELSPAMLAIARQRAAGLGRDVDLQEGDAEHLPFGDASFDTVVCALSLCTIPSPAAAIGEMKRVLVPGGRLLLLDHIGSTWPPVYAAQWLLERITIRAAGEHFTRRQLPLVHADGFQVVETERLKAGTVERIHAVKPA